jgi:hypothetical protein
MWYFLSMIAKHAMPYKISNLPQNKKARRRDRPLGPAGEFAEQTPSLKLPFVAVLSTTANSQQPTANYTNLSVF